MSGTPVFISGVEVVEDDRGEKEGRCSVPCWCAALLLPLLDPRLGGACREGGHGQLIVQAPLAAARGHCHLCHLSTALPAPAGSSLYQDRVFSLEDGAVSVVPAVLPARGQAFCGLSLISCGTIIPRDGPSHGSWSCSSVNWI